MEKEAQLTLGNAQNHQHELASKCYTFVSLPLNYKEGLEH
jgi:hypothetical protein